jgi:hypothetical protein
VASVEVLRAGRCSGWDERAEYASPSGNATLRRLSITEIGMGATVWACWDVVGSDGEPVLDQETLLLSIGDSACFQPWSPSGDRFAVPILSRWPGGAWRYEVAIVDLRQQAVVQQFDDLFASELIWAPHDDEILAVTNEGPVLLDSRSGQRRSAGVADFYRAGTSCAAWLPSGDGFGCSVWSNGSQRLALFDRHTLLRIGEIALDPLTVAAFEGKDELLEINGGEDIFWRWENEVFPGAIASSDDALRLIFGEWASVAVGPDSSTLLLSVYRPMLDSHGRLAISLGPDDLRTCAIEEVWLRVSLGD